MPIFEYACRKCGKVFEKLVLGKERKLPDCPSCGSKQVSEKYSRFSGTSSTPKSARVCAPSGAG
jgi:putative FmdB family regulatory protein